MYQISRGAIQVDIRPYPAGMVDLISPFYLFAGNWKKKRKCTGNKCPFWEQTVACPQVTFDQACETCNLKLRALYIYRLLIEFWRGVFWYISATQSLYS